MSVPFSCGCSSLPVQVVAVQCDVQRSDGEGGLFDGFDDPRDAAGDEFAAGADADDHDIAGTLVLFQDLVGQAGDRPLEPVAVDDLRFEASHDGLSV